MTFELVPTPEDFERKEGFQLHNLLMCMIEKEISIALGKAGTHFFMNSYLESTNPYYMMSVRWYVPCSAKYPRWSSIFRILYETVGCSDHIHCVCGHFIYTCGAKQLHVRVARVQDSDKFVDQLLGCHSRCHCQPRHAHRPYVRCSSPGYVFLWHSTQCSKHFSQRFLLTPATKHQFKTWMSSSTQILNLPTHQKYISFLREVTKQIYQN